MILTQTTLMNMEWLMKFKVQLVLVTEICFAYAYLLFLNSHFFGSSHLEVLLGEGTLEGCAVNLQGRCLCLDGISTKLQSSFNEITLWRGCSTIGLLHIFGVLFPENTSGGRAASTCFLLWYKSQKWNWNLVRYQSLDTRKMAK